MNVTSMRHDPSVGGFPAPALIGAFESTYLPGPGVDVVETIGHDRLWREDLEWQGRGRRRGLHGAGGEDQHCPTCAEPAPCPTAAGLQW
jgi:hypothetical protein